MIMFVFTLLTKNGTKNITSDLDKRVKGTVRCNIFGTKRKNRWGMCLFQITYKDLKPTVLGSMFISNLLLFIGQSLFSWRTHCFRCQPSSVFPPLRLSHQECGLFGLLDLMFHMEEVGVQNSDEDPQEVIVARPASGLHHQRRHFLECCTHGAI